VATRIRANFASGLWRHDGGSSTTPGYAKQAVRANLDQDFGKRVTFSLQTDATKSLAQRGLTNIDNAGVSFWMVFPFTPNFLDLRQTSDGTYPANHFGNISISAANGALMKKRTRRCCDRYSPVASRSTPFSVRRST